MLLPLAAEPFTAPADREMLPSERRTFVRTHRTCVFGYRRMHDGPGMSVVYYIPTDDDELLVSTMAGRGKAPGLARDGKGSIPSPRVTCTATTRGKSSRTGPRPPCRGTRQTRPDRRSRPAWSRAVRTVK